MNSCTKLEIPKFGIIINLKYLVEYNFTNLYQIFNKTHCVLVQFHQTFTETTLVLIYSRIDRSIFSIVFCRQCENTKYPQVEVMLRKK